MEDLSLNVELEDLKKMSVSDRALLMRKLIRRCQKQNNVIDCPSCKLYYTLDCWFTELFNVKHIKVKTSNKKRLTYTERWEQRINEKIKEWKEGKIK